MKVRTVLVGDKEIVTVSMSRKQAKRITARLGTIQGYQDSAEQDLFSLYNKLADHFEKEEKKQK